MSDSEFDEILDPPAFKDLVDEPELLSLLAEDRQEIVGAVRSPVSYTHLTLPTILLV